MHSLKAVYLREITVALIEAGTYNEIQAGTKPFIP